MQEALSTARPSRLRLAGFVTLVAGGAMLGVGAISTWGSIGFPEEVDPTRAVTAPIPGIDLWEGVLCLLAGAVVLIGMVTLRLVRRPATRRIVAVVITVVGFGAAALAATVALGAEARLVQTEGLDAYARSLSEALELPYDQVRRDIEDVFRQDLVVRTEPGVWVAVAGGVLAGAGGILSLIWIRERERALPAEPDPPRPLFA
jgi:hypothetical protein